MATEDYTMWCPRVTEAFINIMLDEVKKERGTVTRKNRSFTREQWNQFNNEMVVRVNRDYGPDRLREKFGRMAKDWRVFHSMVKETGLGWCHNRKTVTCAPDVWRVYVQAHPDAAKFLSKGLDFYEELTEMLTGRFATGAYARGSTQGAPDSDEEKEMEQHMRRELGEGSGKKKRKSQSTDTGGSNKSSKYENTLDAFTSCSIAREKFYAAHTPSLNGPPPSDPEKESITECINILESLENLPWPVYYWASQQTLKANWRHVFLAIGEDNRVRWLMKGYDGT